MLIFSIFIKFFPPMSMIHHEFFKNNEFIETYKSYIKNILFYLNPNYINNDNEINDMLELSRKLSFVSYKLNDYKLIFNKIKLFK